jgi:NADH-quinone oxidoreductase subunit K
MMAAVPLAFALWFAAALFALGLMGVMLRRNLLFILMSIEIMLNAAGVAFIAAGARWGQADGQVMFILILTLAASEVAVGLAMVLQIHRRRDTVDADAADELRG